MSDPLYNVGAPVLSFSDRGGHSQEGRILTHGPKKQKPHVLFLFLFFLKIFVEIISITIFIEHQLY